MGERSIAQEKQKTLIQSEGGGTVLEMLQKLNALPFDRPARGTCGTCLSSTWLPTAFCYEGTRAGARPPTPVEKGCWRVVGRWDTPRGWLLLIARSRHCPRTMTAAQPGHAAAENEPSNVQIQTARGGKRKKKKKKKGADAQSWIGAKAR